MSAEQFLELVTQILFVCIFLIVLRATVRRPLSARIDVALFFGAAAALAILEFSEATLHLPATRPVATAAYVLLMTLPYLFLRLVADTTVLPTNLLRSAAVGLILIVMALIVVPPPPPLGLLAVLVVYFVGLEVYGAALIIREARHSRGATHRRMQAAAIGSVSLGIAMIMVGLAAIIPSAAYIFALASELASLGAAISYYVGFAPPAWLRGAWQEPELRLFLEHVGSLSRQGSRDVIVRELEAGVARTLGAPLALIATWNGQSGNLSVRIRAKEETIRPSDGLLGRVFTNQRPTFSTDLGQEYPRYADLYAGYSVHVALAAPMTLGAYKLGALAVYLPRTPLFVEDDLALVQLLATQAALILEIRNLIDETARLVAQQEALRLKEDFISAAAHELKTPLTVVLGQAQLIARQAAREPDRSIVLDRTNRLVSEAKRLSGLISELLDATQKGPREIVGPREPVNLAQVASEVCHEHTAPRHRCVVEATRPVIGSYERVTIREMLEHLIGNAIAFSPAGGQIRIKIWEEGSSAHLTVTDEGIGIPQADLPHLFERFYRGENVDARRFPGMGLGLYIAYRIVSQNHGRIWATSLGPGRGSSFHVVLPLAPVVSAEANGDRIAS